MVRVRYAPSPTGLLHIGNARTAIFNYLFARHHGGKFIIRIEDTDVERNVEGGEKSQLDNLSWLGIDWDESIDKGGPYGPYRQLERLDLYKKYADILLEKGLAYKEYREDSKNYGIRFKVPEGKKYEFNDLVRGKLTFQSEEVEDWIIIKDNGIPTYNFAVVIDDHFMKITHVLRGEEHITNTPKQIMVYEAFGWDVPLFGHMTLIVNEEKKKLSKRDKNIVQFISQYKDLGYLPEALLNFITLLGWSPPINEEILSKEELIKLFDSNRLTKAPSMFDKDKLTFINHTYIKKLNEEEILVFVKPFLENAGIKKDEDWLLKFSSMLQDRCLYGAHIVELYNEFFTKEFKLTEEALEFLKQDDFKLLIETLKKNLSKCDPSLEAISEAIKVSGQEAEKKGKNLYMPVRIATTGLLHGPELAKMIYLLGKKTVISRIDKTLETLKEKKI